MPDFNTLFISGVIGAFVVFGVSLAAAQLYVGTMPKDRK